MYCGRKAPNSDVTSAVTDANIRSKWVQENQQDHRRVRIWQQSRMKCGWEGIALSASLGQIDIAPAANDTYAVHHQKLMIRIIRRKVIARRSIQSTMLSTHQFLITMATLMIRQDKELTTNRDIGYLSCFLIAHQTTDSMHTPRRIGKRISTKGGNERQGNQSKWRINYI